LLRELISEWKKVDLSNKELLKKINENKANVTTKYQLAITACNKIIANREVKLVRQKAVVDTYKVRLATKEETHKAKHHEWEVEHDTAVAILNGRLDVKKTVAITKRFKALTTTCDFATASKQLK
jgi:hypothetical protein